MATEDAKRRDEPANGLGLVREGELVTRCLDYREHGDDGHHGKHGSEGPAMQRDYEGSLSRPPASRGSTARGLKSTLCCRPVRSHRYEGVHAADDDGRRKKAVV